MVCTFFGHKDTPSTVTDDLKKEILSAIEERDVRTFYVGNHGSFDRMAFSALNKIKEVYPHIEFHTVLAYLPHNNGEDYSQSIFPEGIEEVPKRFAISFRNKWMIDNSDMVIAYVKYSFGGAAKFLEMARKKKKTVINIAEKG